MYIYNNVFSRFHFPSSCAKQISYTNQVSYPFSHPGITFPSGEVQKTLLLEVYDEAGLDPGTVNYVEAHGTGTKAGDPQELNSVTEVFTTPARPKGTPLLIGSTKSNMGHPEPASGLCFLTAVQSLPIHIFNTIHHFYKSDVYNILFFMGIILINVYYIIYK